MSCVLVAHLTGTLLVLVMEPQVAFQHENPLLLTTVGEFVMKNVVVDLGRAADCVAPATPVISTHSGSAARSESPRRVRTLHFF